MTLADRRRAINPAVPDLSVLTNIKESESEDIKVTKHIQPKPPKEPNDLEFSPARPHHKTATELHPDTHYTMPAHLVTKAGYSAWVSGSSLPPAAPFSESSPRDVRSPRPDYVPRFAVSPDAPLRSPFQLPSAASPRFSPFPPQHTPATPYSFRSQSPPSLPWLNSELWYPDDWENSTVCTGRLSEMRDDSPEYPPAPAPHAEYALPEQYTPRRGDRNRYEEEAPWPGAPEYPSPPYIYCWAGYPRYSPSHTRQSTQALHYAPQYSPSRPEYPSPGRIPCYSDRNRGRSASPPRRRQAFSPSPPPPADLWAQYHGPRPQYSPPYAESSYQARQYASEYRAPRSPRVERVEYASPGYRTPTLRHAERGRCGAVSPPRRPHRASPPPPHIALWSQAHHYAPQCCAPRSPRVERMEYYPSPRYPTPTPHYSDPCRRRAASPPRRSRYPSVSPDPVAGPPPRPFGEYGLADVEVPCPPPVPFYVQRRGYDGYLTPTRDHHVSAPYQFSSEQGAQNIQLEDSYHRYGLTLPSRDYFGSDFYSQVLQQPSSDHSDEWYEADRQVSRKRGRAEDAPFDVQDRDTKRARGSPRGDYTLSLVHPSRRRG